MLSEEECLFSLRTIHINYDMVIEYGGIRNGISVAETFKTEMIIDYCRDLLADEN